MMGEQDLSPAGWFTHPPGRRLPSMMAPTIVLDDGFAGTGARLGRLKPDPLAIVQVIVNAIDRGMDAQAAVDAPRLHFEDGLVYAEPGIEAAALEAAGRGGLVSRAQPVLRRLPGGRAPPRDAAPSAAAGIRAGAGRWCARGP